MMMLAAALLLLSRETAPVPAAKIDAFVEGEMRKQRIPGVSLAVLRNGKPVYTKGYGLANVEHRVAVTPDTVFQSGSVGKQFTAAAVLLLRRDGKWEVDDPVAKHLKNAPPAWDKVTIRHLLTHTGGMTDYPEKFDFRRDWSEDELIEEAAKIPLVSAPGAKWRYSNMGYVMLGILVSKVTGRFYGEFLRERIFEPLGMKTARVISEADIVPNRAAGYRLENGELKNQHWVSPVLNTTGDGSLYLTVHDMAKWDAALYGEGLLDESTKREMWSKVALNGGKLEDYGYGWRVTEAARGRKLIEHGGSWQGFRSHIARYVDSKLTIVTFANLAQGDAAAIAHGVAKMVDPKPAP